MTTVPSWQKELKQSLELALLTADQADREQDVAEVWNILTPWLSNVEVWEVMESNLHDTEQELATFLAIGMAGLLRIGHVSQNRLLSPSSPADSDTSTNIAQLRQTRAKLPSELLAPWTITNDPISWPGEFAQDDAQSLIKLGATDEATAEMNKGLAQLGQREQELEDTSAPGDARSIGHAHQERQGKETALKYKEHYPDRHRKMMEYIGVKHALSTLHLRRGQATRSGTDILMALQLQREASSYWPNPDRLSHIAKNALKAATFNESLRTRLALVMYGTATLAGS